jgi:hypothetical protein
MCVVMIENINNKETALDSRNSDADLTVGDEFDQPRRQQLVQPRKKR